MNVLLLTPYQPGSTGIGGDHRAYQIQCELESLPGVDLKILCMRRTPPPAKPSWRDRIRLRTRIQSALKKLVERLVPARLQPLWTVIGRELDGPNAPYLWRFPVTDSLLKEVTDLLDLGTVQMVIVEHPGWRRINDACRKRNIPVICCPQNLESLLFRASMSRGERIPALLHQLQGELEFFQTCNHVLFISRVEAGLAGGLQIPGTSYYPYYPGGHLKERLLAVKAARSHTPPDPELLLLIGSFPHPPIGDGMTWLVEQIARHGLPEGKKLVVIGKDSEKLAQKFPNLKGVTWRGWVEDTELDQWLQKASCVLVPLYHGFGALTRIYDTMTAGVPVIASRFATLAVEPHPLLQPVENRWEEWIAAIKAPQPTSENQPPEPPAPSQLAALARLYVPAP